MSIEHSRDEWLDFTDQQLLQLCRQEQFRSSGPGGQHRNRRDSAVRLTIKDLDVSVEADEDRSQHKNKEQAVKRLRIAIAYHLRSDEAPVWNGSNILNAKNPQYPKLVAIILDSFAQNEWSVKNAANALGWSTGNLNKVLMRDQQLLAKVNRERHNKGYSPLKRR
ncbi:MAG: peptide chain release factor-like protein [Lentisphaeria bacterium]|nr:peptide chain release factor-like protein [Lentisphaeria bacterium]